MPIDLESLTPGLFSTVDDRLGDTITIAPPSGLPATIKVHATHRDNRVDFGISAATVQDARIDMSKALVTGKPGEGWIVTLPLIPGKSFKPIGVETDDSGMRWIFGLKELKNA